MPTVARRLGVSHSTLYRYVHDRDDLVLAALDLAMREFEWPQATLGWRDLLAAFADALWRFLQKYPGMAEAMQSAPGLPSTIAELAGAYVARLRAEGLTVRDAAVAVDFVADLTIGTEIALRGINRLYDTPRGRRSLREIYFEAWSSIGGLEGVATTKMTDTHDRGWLDSKLAMLVDGLATRLGEAPGPHPCPPEPTSETAGQEADRETIVASGRTLARRSGLAAVSLRTVAHDVGSTLAVLRREVGDRDGLVVAMLDAVAADIVVPETVAAPRDEVVALAMAVYETLLSDPWVVPALAVDGLASPLILPVLDRMYAAFVAAGVPTDEVADTSQMIWDHVYGTVLSDGHISTFAREMVASADTPAITEAALVPATSPNRARRGIELLVDGLIG